MRFVLAIAAFFAAAVMIGLGIAQRTVFLEPDRVSLSVDVDSDLASYAVLDPEALAAYPGRQSIAVGGEGTVFLAYGRTSDVRAWLGDTPYVEVGFDAATGELVSGLAGEAAEDDDEEAPSTTPPATSSPAPSATVDPSTAPPEATADDSDAAADAVAEPAVSPAGSDLWLDELSADRRATTTVDLPDDVSVLIASGSEDPLPDRVAIAWPLDNATPWAGPLIVGGGLVFLLGVALLIAGIIGHRRGRGPRRNLPKGRQNRLPSAPRPNRLALGGGSGGRRSAGRRTLVATLVLVPAFALTACSADYWPSFDQSPSVTETPGPTPDADDDADEPEAAPVVTVPQWERIMGKVAVVAAAADESRDTAALGTRFAGPALEARTANYAIRANQADYAPLPAIQAEPLTLILPQQARADQWPRTVMTVVTNEQDETVPPNVLVLSQASPRENYKITYAMSLAPDPGFPEVAPASVGAPLISPDYKGLVMPPSAVAGAFASVAQDGAASPQAESFDLEDTELDNLLDAATRKSEVQGANPTVTLDITTAPATSPIVALGTIDAGALVSATILRTEQSRPNDGGTTGFQEGGPARALSGFAGQSARGVQSTRAVQILFAVPSVGASDEQIRVLGWSESLIAASEIP